MVPSLQKFSAYQVPQFPRPRVSGTFRPPHAEIRSFVLPQRQVSIMEGRLNNANRFWYRTSNSFGVELSWFALTLGPINYPIEPKLSNSEGSSTCAILQIPTLLVIAQCLVHKNTSEERYFLPFTVYYGTDWKLGNGRKMSGETLSGLVTGRCPGKVLFRYKRIRPLRESIEVKGTYCSNTRSFMLLVTFGMLNDANKPNP